MAQINQLVKLPFQKATYTSKQLDELVNCTDPINGPLYFMKQFVHVQHPLKGEMKFIPFPFQEELIKVYHSYRKSIAMISRQCGKSTCAAAYLLWYAMFNPDSMILIASKTHMDAMEIMHRIRFAYESLPDHIRAGAMSYNKKSIEFDNGSRIISQATTENTGRGLSVSLVYLDEFAYVGKGNLNVAKEFWTSISPTLSTGGKCIITSTPNSDEDQFAMLWFGANNNKDEFGNEVELGENGFKAFFADWRQHPERDEIWAQSERAAITEDRFNREHNCQFIRWDETLINASKLIQLQAKQPIKKFENQVRWFKEIDPKNAYVVALDPSMGTGGNSSAIQVFELPSMIQVAEWQHNKSAIEQQLSILKSINQEIYSHGQPTIYWSVENNSLGEAALVVIREVGEESFAGMMIHDPQRGQGKVRRGFTTTTKNKVEACAKLKTWIEKDKMILNSRNLISEFKNFVRHGESYAAKSGSTDDLVMATVLATRMIKYISSFDDSTFNTINTSLRDLDGDGDIEMPMPIMIV